jgi:hypothetical protein
MTNYHQAEKRANNWPGSLAVVAKDTQLLLQTPQLILTSFEITSLSVRCRLCRKNDFKYLYHTRISECRIVLEKTLILLSN